ncbi:hypothetical protein [Cytophaga aurantiaca]|uniref:hypothetical protein n=1 Tax=Cytophaga aurantiaca TaxID=29530 RepID=UPI00036B346C|nr:hypothetical protein [Cytophaga aurantiaca]
MYIRILILSFLLCCSTSSFAQKLWRFAKDSCIPADLAKRTLYFPVSENDKLPYNYEKAKKIFKRYYPYNYVFISEDSLEALSMDSLNNGYALRKEQVSRRMTTSSPTYGYSNGGFGNTGYSYSSSTYQTYIYNFTKASSSESDYKPLKIYSSVRHKTLQMLIRNIYYDIPANRPKHCFKINLGVPFTQYPRIGASYEFLIQRKTSLGLYMEAGSWTYGADSYSYQTSSTFVLFQPQLIRYMALFKNHAYDGLFVGISPFIFYNKDRVNPSNPYASVYPDHATGYGVKGMLGIQFLIARRVILGGWAGPQFRFGSADSFQGQNSFLSSVYPQLFPTAQVYAGFVLR